MISSKKIHPKETKNIFSLFINYILPIFFIFMGIFQSFRERLLFWPVENDELALPRIINEINIHGWSFLKDYNFPLDNWIFSLIIPYKFLSLYFNLTPNFIIIFGMMIFYLSAFFTALIVYHFSGITKALWSAAFILMAPQTALLLDGFLTYSVSHNISMLWGLLALILYIFWIHYKSFLALIFAIFILTFSTFSDPWLIPTFDLPLICASLWMLYLNKKDYFKTNYKIWLGIIISSCCILLISKTNFFHFIHIKNINSSDYTKIKFSFKYLFKTILSLPYYFNFIPFCDLTKFKFYISTKNIIQLIFIIFAIITNIIFFVYSFIYIYIKLLKNIKNQNKEKNFLISFILFSILGITSSIFLLGNFEIHFLITIYYFSIILIFIAPYQKFSSHFKKILINLIILFISSSFISNSSAYFYQKDNKLTKNFNIIPILKENNITTIYGTFNGIDITELYLSPHYHGYSLAYADGYNGFLPNIWSSPSWYQQNDNQRWGIILTGLYKHGDSICPPFPSCQNAVIHQFGQPIERKDIKGMTLFIYDSHTKLPSHLTDITWTDSLPITNNDFSYWHSYYPNDQLNLNDLITINGWDWEHIHNHQINTNENWASFIIPITISRHQLHIRITLTSSTPTNRNTPIYHDVDLIYKNKIIAQWRLLDVKTVKEFDIPIDLKQRNAEFKIHILNPTKGRKGNLMGITLSEIQVVDDE